MKRIKYRVKGMLLARRPGWYWAARKLFKGYLEPEIALLQHVCAGDGAFVDVGASWGAYSHAALARGLVVHAFEPQMEIALVLQRGLPGAVIRCAAASDHTGETELRIPRNDIGYATVELRNALSGTADLSKGMDRRCVPTIRLDDADLGRVSLLKVDVEGHELAVLRGARELLERHHPMLIIEVEERHAAGSREAVWELLNTMGYSSFVLTNEKRLRTCSRQDVDRVSQRNLVFIHDPLATFVEATQ